jgi:hypothetical protein
MVIIKQAQMAHGRSGKGEQTPSACGIGDEGQGIEYASERYGPVKIQLNRPHLHNAPKCGLKLSRHESLTALS